MTVREKPVSWVTETVGCKEEVIQTYKRAKVKELGVFTFHQVGKKEERYLVIQLWITLTPERIKSLCRQVKEKHKNCVFWNFTRVIL